MIRNPLTQVNSRYLFRFRSVFKNFLEMSLQIHLKEIIFHLRMQIFIKKIKELK